MKLYRDNGLYWLLVVALNSSSQMCNLPIQQQWYCREQTHIIRKIPNNPINTNYIYISHFQFNLIPTLSIMLLDCFNSEDFIHYSLSQWPEYFLICDQKDTIYVNVSFSICKTIAIKFKCHLGKINNLGKIMLWPYNAYSII